MTYTSATCTVEDDGFHTHEYQHGAEVVTEHLHSWMAEHAANWPDSKPVDIRRGQRYLSGHDSLAEAWAELTNRPLPEVTCEVAR